ncbi:MAG TPA: hypothetical protein VL947_11525, partial [Cytophagales bacterium]|nr:hypothetical protein [Cytophagales bacterium]
TWTYPKDSIEVDQINVLLLAYRNAIKETYKSYLDETQAFSKSPKPPLGNLWPSDGYYLPSLEVFLDSAHQIAAPKTLEYLLNLSSK